MLRILAPAKLNLHLQVLAREAGGYHQLETVFCALELGDRLEIALTDRDGHLEIAAEPGEPGLPGRIEDDLVYRAARLFFAESGVAGGARIRLHKHVPVGAGLGGGSSDAAATLLALDRLCREPLGLAGRLRLAARLGSDVPFFLCGSPLALGWGRGERLLPLEPLPSLPVLLVVPEQRVLTSDAFAALDRRRGDSPAAPMPRVLTASLLCDWERLAAEARNDFEEVVFEQLPVLGDAVRCLQQEGALLARLTGSGSAVYGIFRDGGSSQRAARTLETLGQRVLLTRTAAPPAPPPFG